MQYNHVALCRVEHRESRIALDKAPLGVISAFHESMERPSSHCIGSPYCLVLALITSGLIISLVASIFMNGGVLTS